MEEKTEFFTDEGCYITELHNTEQDPAVSVARARVPPGALTALHTVNVDDRYLVEAGRGIVFVGANEPRAVGPGDTVWIPADTPQRIRNVDAEALLVFLCVCTPRFTPSGYSELERASSRGGPASE
jgi:mannose-6-phosphate isomerase-like protein (cupin superfamily)